MREARHLNHKSRLERWKWAIPGSWEAGPLTARHSALLTHARAPERDLPSALIEGRRFSSAMPAGTWAKIELKVAVSER